MLSRPLTIIVLSLFLGNQSQASDEKGAFMTGGGVGGVSCPEFIDAMATARQNGGLSSIAGINQINAFAQYIGGFRTGYNLGTPGVYDIFASFGESPINKALIMIDAWCSKEPTASFDAGLFDLLNSLRNKTSQN